MIFAVATDEKSLHVFPTEAAAVAYCEGIDVQAGTWLFWNRYGVALQPEFLAPNQQGRLFVASGAYRLVPAAGPAASLGERLAGIAVIEGNPYFSSLAAIEAHLAGAAAAFRHGA